MNKVTNIIITYLLVMLENSLKYRGIFCTIDFVKEYANSIAELIKEEYLE